MSLQTAPDITVTISIPSLNPTSQTSSSTPTLATERRISPTWTISTLKSKLEPITGIPPSSQSLRLLTPSGYLPLSEANNAHVSDYPFRTPSGSEIEITDLRPPGMRENYSDVSKVEKFELPMQEYEKLDDSVLAWKRRRGLGRFDPNARSREEVEAERRSRDWNEIKERGVEVGKRCRVGKDDGRRGVVRFVGEVEGLGGERERGCVWVGVELDEPVGRNDGSVGVVVEGGREEVRRVFECKPKFGVFARPEKIEMGEWPVLDDLMADEDMEEI